MATQFDPSSGTFTDDGVNDTPTDYTAPLTESLNGGTQPPPLDTGYSAPLQKALAQTQAPAPAQPDQQSPGAQDGLALPAIDVNKIADKIGGVGAKPLEVPPLNPVATPSATSTPPIPSAAPVPGAPATATHRTVLSPESQGAINQLDAATANEGAAQRQLGDTRADRAAVTAQGAQDAARMQAERQQRIQDRVAKAQADYDARVKEYDQQYTKLKGMKETDFYADKSTGYTIASAISVALGAVSQAFGGKNVGAELIAKEIEAHAARQKGDIVNQRELTEKAHVGLEGAKNEVDRQSLLWETAAFDRAAADVTSRAAQFGGQEERQKAQVVASQLEAKSAEKKALLLKMTGEQVVTDTGRQTEEERLRLAKEQAAAKAKAKGAGGGPGGQHSAALQELIDGASAADVQAKYKIGDKALGKLVETATKAQKTGTGASNENSPLSVRRTDGSVAGLAALAKNVDVLQTRYRNYEDAIHSLRELAASGKTIPVGSDLYNRAVLAVAAVSTNNITDHTTEAEAATLKGYGLLSQNAIKRTLDHVQSRFSAFDKQLRPVRETTAASGASSYVDAAKAAKAKMSGGEEAGTNGASALPAGLPQGSTATGRVTKDGRKVYKLPSGQMVAGGV